MRKSMNNQRRFPSLFVATLLISLLGAAGCDYVIYMGEPTENECEPECAENQVCKNGKCEPTTDVNVCALECPDGFKCVDNECVCAYSSHIKCSDACVDLQVDKSNCGKCGNQCDVYCSLGCCDGLQRCGGSDDPCVDLMTDSKNCGGCGIVCNENTQRCANGNCVLETKCESDSDCSQEHQICDTNTNYCICEKGYEVCNDTGVCIDLSDPKTCGSCANDCYTEGVKEARCEDRENDKVCVAVQCEDSYRKCDDACVYIYTNKDHCGSCNNPCLGLNVCMDGTCTSCNDAENPNPCDRVTSKCTNFSTDPKNCNGCGDEFECGMNQNCEGGECKCINTSEVSCGKGCFSDTQTNTERCGPNCLNCNELPGVETATCSEGVCFIYTCKTSLHYQQNTRDDKCICAEGYTECDEHCVDTNTDTKNCGVCGTDCDANKPENAVMACENGTCVVKSCENGQELCDGICLDASSDKNHCGMCNNICGENQKCEQGVCTCIDQEVEYRACELKYNDRSFYICLGQNADCDEFEQTTGDNYVCLNDKCICVGDDEGKTVCESKNNTNANSGVKVCVDTKNDSQYCGACDKACDDDEICKEGKCEKNPCASNSKTPYYCSGECFDIKTDINNCGNCGNKCIVDGVIEAVC